MSCEETAQAAYDATSMRLQAAASGPDDSRRIGHVTLDQAKLKLLDKRIPPLRLSDARTQSSI